MTGNEKLQGSIDTDKIRERAISARAVIIICGPTCTGKSRVAIKLAGILSTNIISVDSMQVYTGMDIGTDKYDVKKYGLKQFMVDIAAPHESFTVVDFRRICRKIIQEEFFDKGRIPILAGGSGLYLRAVTDELGFTGNNIAGSRITEKDKDSSAQLYGELAMVDPVYAAKISCNDTRRILRALEVYRSTGRAFSSFQDTWNKRESIYKAIFIGLNSDKAEIFSCIEKRVDDMLSKGLVDEVRGLAEKGYGKYNSLIQAVGYKEVLDHLNGLADISECRQNIIKNTKKLVKKQLTWFKADPRINWISVNNYVDISALAEEILMIINSKLNVWGY